jgi:hypothetical protein
MFLASSPLCLRYVFGVALGFTGKLAGSFHIPESYMREC